MKKVLLFVFMLISIPGYSQKTISGNFQLPEEEKYLAVDWDCSQTLFEKKHNEKEWESLIGKEEWEKAKSESLSDILVEMNNKMRKARITVVKPTNELKANYTMYIAPIKLNRKGDNTSFYILKRNSDGVEVGRVKLSGDGGSFGSLANLLWDGYEEESRKMGSYLTRNNKSK